MMLLLSLLLLAAQEPSAGRTVQVRLTTGEEFTAEIVSGDADGIVLRRQGPMEPYETYFRWTQLEEGASRSLRALILGAPSTESAEVVAAVTTLPGLRVRLADGRTILGVDTPYSDETTLRLKTAEGIEAIPRDRISSQEPMDVPLSAAFSTEEIHDRLLHRLAPLTPEDWESFGRALEEQGVRDRAAVAFQIAGVLRRASSPDHALYQALMRMQEAIDEPALQAEVYRVVEAYMAGRYDESLRTVEDLAARVAEASHAPSVDEELERLRGELQVLRHISAEARIVSEWEGAAEARLHAKALDRAVGLADAANWARQDLVREVEEDVASRLGYSAGDPSVRDAWDRRPAERRLVHAYGDASWVVDRLETYEAREWWDRADSAARRRLLLGLYVEGNLNVIQVDPQNCPECGATGTIPRSGGPDAVCPACQGTRFQRVLIYR